MGTFLVELTELTFGHILQALAVFIIVAEVYKKIKEVKKESDLDFERKQGWDKAAKTIKEKEGKWDVALLDMETGRKSIIQHFEKRLDEVDDKLEEQKTDYESKMQELKVELFVQTECMRAVLEGLKQLDCNGPVTDAQVLLNNYLSGSAHDIKDIEKLLKRGA